MADKKATEKKKIAAAGAVVDISTGDAIEADGKKKKRKKSKVAPFLILFFVILALLTVTYVTFYFNFWNVRTTVFTFVHGLDPDYRAIELREQELEVWEEKLEALNSQSITERNELASLEAQLKEKEAYLANQEASRKPIYRPPVNEEDALYMQGIGKIYSSMEPENAAEIMTRLYTIQDMAAIIYYMSQASAGAIMECMDPDTAAAITDRLLNE